MITIRIHGRPTQRRRSDNGVRSETAHRPAALLALLIGELACPGTAVGEQVKAAVLIASVTAALSATLLLRRRNAVYRRLYEEENLDEDADGVPDIYQRTASGST
ncbi:hypothetical protein ACFWAZ_13955 [Streptomyces collinus]|uniref:hypothetical protein n=1 Tax=Streptomyces collinus TaxID=42684 RepID=UPI003667167F